ncbi:hypothetical protein [Pontimicrobium sp. SW4]|uniref:DUF4870 domain-containing protein n=1 Tax=Pontimicrobium sp. SW4 TaxID=3153519 RepID=A0AAU7BWZ4_9FLAO
MDNQTVEEGRTIAIISYLTLFGVIIAFFMNNEKKNRFAAFHLRQALGLWLTFFALGYFVGLFDNWLITIGFWIFFGVLFIFGFMTAVTGRNQPTPILGEFYQRIFASFGN